MRLPIPGKKWWFILVMVLGVAAFWGWRLFPADHDHPKHQHDHPDHGNHEPQERQHDHPAGEVHPEATVSGQVKLTPAGVQQAGIETAPVVFGPWDNRLALTGELVFNEDRLARIRSRVPGRVVKIAADYGQTVQPGSILAVIDSVELSQAHMASRQAAARLNAAQKSSDRARQLYEGKAISLAELQERQARLEVEKADLENAQNRLRLLGADSWPPGSQADAKSAVKTASGAVFTLRSPLAGRVVDRKITPGLVVKEDEELFTIADTSTLWCFVQVPEKDLPLVQIGSQAIVAAGSLPGDQFTGKVDYLADMVDKASRTVRARVRVHNPHNRLKAGMFADIALLVGQRPALSIPAGALQSADGDHFVFVETAPGTYRKHPVKTGAQGGGRVEILSGLAAGEPVVVQGGFTLKSELAKGSNRGGLTDSCGHAH